MITKPFKLTAEEIKPIIETFITLEKPTRARLLRLLGCCDKTLYRTLDRDDEASALISNALLYIAEKHEERLFDSGAAGSIFWLKANSRLIQFRDDYKYHDDTTNVGEYDIKEEIVEKNESKTTNTERE